MPRNHLPGASTLRNRNRITNKTRLKIHQGNLDVDTLLIPDEDEEKNRLTNLVAGVDAEDANELHLQVVLSASQRPHVSTARRGGNEKHDAAYIPTPDSTGVVQDYEEHYPTNRWKDPATYLCASTSVEETCRDGLAGGFTYYMDERDKEWLDKNSEEARGEGTSIQGAVSTSGTRSSARSAKAKGKEPEVTQPVPITEDEFELVMGLFEKITYEKTEFLHHGLETGMTFPPFSDYQETFSSQLPSSIFSNYTVPPWISSPQNLLRIAKNVYPYWKERRIERGGHRVIPTLNNDETDTLNESYICFRRREIKAVRKTRASQATSSDKLARLNAEFQYPLELAKAVLTRESIKKEVAQQAQAVWEKRAALVDLKRKFPSLGDKNDEDLLIDKERPAKKPELSRLPLKLRTHEAGLPPARTELAIRPRDRAALIREQIENQLARQKELDHHWEDQIDNAYQPKPIPYASRLFKYIPLSRTASSSTETDEESIQRHPRAIRSRIGRGGCIRFDRRHAVPRVLAHGLRRSALLATDIADQREGKSPSEGDEDLHRLTERWRFDADDVPAFGSQGADEQDRMLIDDYDTKYLRHMMTYMSESDQHSLVTDPSIPVPTPEGRYQTVIPFKLGMPIPPMRRDHNGIVRPYPPGMVPQGHIGVPQLPVPNGTPVSVQQQLKKMHPPNNLPQMRISSNGGMRPSVVSAVANLQATPPQVPAVPSSPLNVPVVSHPSPSVTNGGGRAAMNMPHVDAHKVDSHSNSTLVNGVTSAAQPEANGQTQDPGVNGTPVRPKSQNQPATGLATNGYHLASIANYTTAALGNPATFAQYANSQHTGLSMQQVQNLKSAFANLPTQDLAAMANRSLQGSYMHLPNARNLNVQLSTAAAASNLNLKLPAAQPMQWTTSPPLQRPNSAVNGMDSQPLNSPVSPTSNGTHTTPVRTPSANGTRANGMRAGVMTNGQLSMSPHLPHSPSPMPSTIAQSQSPPRLPMTPTMGIASPSLQHQQVVGNTQSGY
ncbi:hypothetical protein AX17_007482 [Amanita inopinata Kibby_2008]|nr:hypothetical protein AX17_007482 [Amanita inopinata Kibby_2008]